MKGFSLLEVLMAMVVVSMAVVAFGSLMTSSVRGVTRLDKFVIANFLTIDELENVRQVRDSNYLFYLRNSASTTKNWLAGIPLNTTTTRSMTLSDSVTYQIGRQTVCVSTDNGGNCIKVKVTIAATANGQAAGGMVSYLYDYIPPVEQF